MSLPSTRSRFNDPAISQPFDSSRPILPQSSRRVANISAAACRDASGPIGTHCGVSGRIPCAQSHPGKRAAGPNTALV